MTSAVALVTGGTTGIGLATARLLHTRGYAVVVTGRNAETLAEARRTLPEDVVVLRADAKSLADADNVVAEIKLRFGKLDLVFLNAALIAMAPLEAVDEAGFDAHFAVNVKGPYFQLQKLLALLGPGSSVIVTSSIIGERGVAASSVYSATKGAQLALVRALAIELAPRHIRVNSISPGVISTPAHDKLGMPPEQLRGMFDALTARIPFGRMGNADEVAHAVAFLASPEASFITGANLMVGGGFGVG